MGMENPEPWSVCYDFLTSADRSQERDTKGPEMYAMIYALYKKLQLEWLLWEKTIDFKQVQT